MLLLFYHASITPVILWQPNNNIIFFFSAECSIVVSSLNDGETGQTPLHLSLCGIKKSKSLCLANLNTLNYLKFKLCF